MPPFDPPHAEDEERHRAFYGFCMSPCEHPDCRAAHDPNDADEHGDPGA